MTTFPIRASLTVIGTNCRSKSKQHSVPLTKHQVKFAEKNHKLVYAFLAERHYDPNEFYDLAAIGFLRAVVRYCSLPYLRRFSFSTVAYRSMQQSILSWQRGEKRRRNAEDTYCALRTHTKSISNVEPSETYLISELQSCGTPQQAMLASLRLQGYSISEVAARCNLTPQRVRRMLESLCSAYLRFHEDSKEAI